MENIASDIDAPWLATRDFNIIFSMEKCKGGAPINIRNMEEFNSSMFNYGLSSLDFDGSRFTWTNGSV